MRKRLARVAMNADRRLTFEGFSLDLTNERLVCDGEVVALTPKAFAVLRRLVEGGGKLVTKAELLRAGWVDTHVSDGVIKLSILEIRRALGDDSSAPRFIVQSHHGLHFGVLRPLNRDCPLREGPYDS